MLTKSAMTWFAERGIFVLVLLFISGACSRVAAQPSARASAQLAPQTDAELNRAKNVAQAAAHKRLEPFARLLATRDVSGIRAYFSDALAARESVEETRRLLEQLKLQDGAPIWVQVHRPRVCDTPELHCQRRYYSAGWETVQDQLLVIDEDAHGHATRFEIHDYSCLDRKDCWAGEVQLAAGSREELAGFGYGVLEHVEAVMRAAPPKKSAAPIKLKLAPFTDKQLSGNPDIALPAARKRFEKFESRLATLDIDGVRAYFSDELLASQSADETRWLVAQLGSPVARSITWVQVCKPTAEDRDGIALHGCRRGYYSDGWRTVIDQLLVNDSDAAGHITRFEIRRYRCIPHSGCWAGYVRAPAGTLEGAAEYAEETQDDERANRERRR